MQDIFHEQLVKRDLSGTDKLKRLGLILMVAMVLTASMTFIPFPMLSMFVAIGFGYLAYILIGRLKREYEYSYTNGELDIDVIYNKSSRKRIFSGQVRDFEIMAHTEDSSHQNSFSSVNTKMDCSTGILSDRSYTFVANYESKRVAITIEPNDEILALLAKALTRRKFHPKR